MSESIELDWAIKDTQFVLTKTRKRKYYELECRKCGNKRTARYDHAQHIKCLACYA